MAEPELRLRAATAEDEAFAFRVWKAAMRTYIDATWGWDEGDQRRRQGEEFAAAAYRIIEVAGRPAGTLVVERRPECLYLSGLYLLPECQGRGVGSRVLAGVLAEARALELPVRLRVLRANPDARRLYARAGFLVADDAEPAFVVMERAPRPPSREPGPDGPGGNSGPGGNK